MEESKQKSLKVVLRPTGRPTGRGTRASAIPRCGHCHTCLHPHLKKSCITNRDLVPRVTKKGKKEVEAVSPTPIYMPRPLSPRYRKWKQSWEDLPTLLGTGRIQIKKWKGMEDSKRDLKEVLKEQERLQIMFGRSKEQDRASQAGNGGARGRGGISLPSPAGGVHVGAFDRQGMDVNTDDLDLYPGTVPDSDGMYVCTQEGCGNRFTDVTSLKRHMATHTGRKYVCHYVGCGKSFLEKSKLKRHFVSHTGEKPFICPFPGCNKAFSLDFNLRTHMRTHTGDSYHICPVPGCDKKYLHEYKLRNHMKNVHS